MNCFCCDIWRVTLVHAAGYVNTELGRANEALTSFANGVDDIVQSPNHSRNYSSCEHVSDIYHSVSHVCDRYPKTPVVGFNSSLVTLPLVSFTFWTKPFCPNSFCLLFQVKHHLVPPHHHNRFTALFPGPPKWAGARRELLDFYDARED